MKQVIENKTKQWIGNSLTNIPAAACSTCGGWTSWGGMSHHSHSKTPVYDRTGCTCREHTSNSEEISLDCLKTKIINNLDDVITNDSMWLNSEFHGSDLLITESFTGTKKTFRVTLTLINE
jgi:hypothetical protein